MIQIIKWRINYLKETIRYRPKSFIEKDYWQTYLPEQIKNKLNLSSKHINKEIYETLKEKYYYNNCFNFKIIYNKKQNNVKYVEPENINEKYSFANEFLDLIYPFLIKEEKYKIRKLIQKISKINSNKMLWQYNKSKFHSIYYYPIIKKEKILYEGHYFDSKFTLDKKSIVYDIGSHLGVFSILASFIVGCKGRVYSFEPSKKFNNYMLKNIKLNKINNIKIINVGIGDKYMKGYMNNMNFINDKNGNITITTLDTLYKNKKIIKPNFIKMDIEGFERNALLGGINLLKESNSKLSICTYHLKDDHKVLKNIIKKINKKYKITTNKYNKKYYAIIK